MIKIDVPQGSPEWFAARAGIPTSSCFDKIVTSKGEPSRQAKNYLYQLAGERITGAKMDTYQNAAMLRGIEMEAEARALFQMVMDIEVEEVGLCYADEQKRVACSPDGLLLDAGLEIKCPLIHTAVGYLLSGSLPTDYFQQIQGSMLVTGFNHYFFMSYYPGLPSLILDVQRDWKFTAALKIELEAFCEELDALEKKLRGLA
ncbi:MAG: lambda exonuclease family protein [Pseudomonadota bacterium]